MAISSLRGQRNSKDPHKNGIGMENTLFTSPSILTMLHGIVLGGGALLTLFAALFSLRAMRATAAAPAPSADQARYLSWLVVATAVLLWLTVLAGTYIVFPPYRTPPPEGLTDLTRYPRALLLSDPSTSWLHAFAMEIKEHVPWIAAMMATAAAFIAARYREQVLSDADIRRTLTVLLGICFVLVAVGALLGTFVNKVAPLY
jgi:hypothetical protein